MTGTGLRVRFAPSPTGALHLGNARTALFNWLTARRAGGTFVLRFEDTDVDRTAEGSEEGILRDLGWLGLRWEEGPDVGGPFGPYRQSQRGAWYAAAARRLLESGHAYRCFCRDEGGETGGRQKGPSRPQPAHGGPCREIGEEASRARAEAGEPFALRFRSVPRNPTPDDFAVRFVDRLRGPVEFPALELGDPVIVRTDGRPTYNFAVVVDDVAMAITLVLRGDDHLSNTPRQVLLYRALGAVVPEFAHLPMVRGPDGERLSKRHGATSVAEYRERGVLPEGLLNALVLLGWSPGGDRTIVTPSEMLDEFDLDRVHRAAAIFDPARLEWIAGHHFHHAPLERILPGVVDRLVRIGWLPEARRDDERAWLEALGELVHGAIESFDHVPERCEAVFLPGGFRLSDDGREALAARGASAVLEALSALLEDGEPEDAAAWGMLKDRLKIATGARGKALFHPVRAAVTGRTSGPELDRVVPLVGLGHRLHPRHVPSLADRVTHALGTIH